MHSLRWMNNGHHSLFQCNSFPKTSARKSQTGAAPEKQPSELSCLSKLRTSSHCAAAWAVHGSVVCHGFAPSICWRNGMEKRLQEARGAKTCRKAQQDWLLTFAYNILQKLREFIWAKVGRSHWFHWFRWFYCFHFTVQRGEREHGLSMSQARFSKVPSEALGIVLEFNIGYLSPWPAHDRHLVATVFTSGFQSSLKLWALLKFWNCIQETQNTQYITIITKSFQIQRICYQCQTFSFHVKWLRGDTSSQACCSCRKTSLHITTIWPRWTSPERIHATQVLLKCAWSAIPLFGHLNVDFTCLSEMFGWTGGEWQSVTQNVTEYDTANEWDYNILVLSISLSLSVYIYIIWAII